MTNKQTVQTTHDGVNVTWHREGAAGNGSAKEAADFYVDTVRALEKFKKQDPRRFPRLRRFVRRTVIAGSCLLFLAAGIWLGAASPKIPRPWEDADAPSKSNAPELPNATTTVSNAITDAPARSPDLDSAPTPAPGIDAARKRIGDDVFAYLAEKTRVTLGRAEFHPRDDGNADVWVPVSWHVDGAPVVRALDAYFWDYDRLPLRIGRVDFSNFGNPGVPGLTLFGRANQRHQKVDYAQPLLTWLSGWQLRIVVELGKLSGHLTIASGRDCPVAECKGVGSQQYQLQFDHDAPDGTLIFSNTHAERDPVVIANVPPDAREALDQIEAKLEWIEPGKQALPSASATGR
jgi:hypothetical protein